jgi:hypothetical protein
VITSLRCIGVEVVPFACVSGTSITLLVQLGAWAIFSILITLGLLAGLGRFSGLGILELNLLPLQTNGLSRCTYVCLKVGFLSFDFGKRTIGLL